jgi:hypothetical protein
MVTPTVVPFPATLELQLRLQFDDVCVGQYALTLLEHTSGTPLLPAGSKLQHDWIRHLRGHARRLVHLSSVLTDDERQSLGTALELLNLDGTGDSPLSICQPSTNNTGVRMIRSSMLPRLFQAFVASPANEQLILILHLGTLTPRRLAHYYLGPPSPSASPTPPPLAPPTENLPGPVGVASSPTASFHSRDMPPRNTKPAPVSIASVNITPTPVPAARSSNPTSLSSTDNPGFTTGDDHCYGTEEGNSFLFTPDADDFAPIHSDTPPLYEDRKPAARVYTVSEDTISDPSGYHASRQPTAARVHFSPPRDHHADHKGNPHVSHPTTRRPTIPTHSTSNNVEESIPYPGFNHYNRSHSIAPPHGSIPTDSRYSTQDDRPTSIYPPGRSTSRQADYRPPFSDHPPVFSVYRLSGSSILRIP